MWLVASRRPPRQLPSFGERRSPETTRGTDGGRYVLLDALATPLGPGVELLGPTLSVGLKSSASMQFSWSGESELMVVVSANRAPSQFAALRGALQSASQSASQSTSQSAPGTNAAGASAEEPLQRGRV
ncbi:hypothetical protein MRX96_010910 [Rhipicephalus microplus]